MAEGVSRFHAPACNARRSIRGLLACLLEHASLTHMPVGRFAYLSKTICVVYLRKSDEVCALSSSTSLSHLLTSHPSPLLRILTSLYILSLPSYPPTPPHTHTRPPESTFSLTLPDLNSFRFRAFSFISMSNSMSKNSSSTKSPSSLHTRSRSRTLCSHVHVHTYMHTLSLLLVLDLKVKLRHHTRIQRPNCVCTCGCA